MGNHVKEQRVLILFAHFPTDLKSVISLSLSFQSQIALNFFLLWFAFASALCSRFWPLLEKSQKPTQLSFLFSPVFSFPVAQLNCISVITFIFFLLILAKGHYSLFNHSPNVGLCLFLYLLSSLMKQRLLQSKMNKDSLVWIVIVPWCGFSFSSSVQSLFLVLVFQMEELFP